MARYASARKTYGISDRSGFRYRLREMRKEWTGLLVGPDEYEPKHPQLEAPNNISDPQAVRDPRPDQTETVSVFTLTDLVGSPTPRLVTFGQVGEVTLITADEAVTLTGVTAIGQVGSVTATGVESSPSIAQTYTVTVQSYLGANKYYIDGVRQNTVSLSEGNTYRFDQSDSSNSGHPLRFSTTSNGTHAGGSEYTTGVTTNGTPGSSGAYTQITVAVGAPTLYYYCTNHSGMGGTANTP